MSQISSPWPCDSKTSAPSNRPQCSASIILTHNDREVSRVHINVSCVVKDRLRLEMLSALPGVEQVVVELEFRSRSSAVFLLYHLAEHVRNHHPTSQHTRTRTHSMDPSQGKLNLVRRLTLVGKHSSVFAVCLCYSVLQLQC